MYFDDTLESVVIGVCVCLYRHASSNWGQRSVCLSAQILTVMLADCGRCFLAVESSSLTGRKVTVIVYLLLCVFYV